MPRSRPTPFWEYVKQLAVHYNITIDQAEEEAHIRWPYLSDEEKQYYRNRALSRRLQEGPRPCPRQDCRQLNGEIRRLEQQIRQLEEDRM